MPDIQGGEVFTNVSPGNSVTSTRLNNHLAGAVILPAFVSAKPATAPATGDKALLYDASGLVLIAPTLADILDLQLKDAITTIASMRTLGAGAAQAAQGSRTPFKDISNIFDGNLQQFKHIGGSEAPAIAAGVALGTGTATLVSGSSDLCGRVVLTPAGTPTNNATLATITFATGFSAAPFIILVAFGTNALAAQTGTKAILATATSTVITLTSGSVPLVAGTAYNYSYLVIAAIP